MPRYPRDARVEVSSFTRQAEGDEVVIGRPESGNYLALPREALEVLDVLAAGRTVGEAQDAFQARHGELPEMEEFLAYLESQSLVRPAGEATGPLDGAAPAAALSSGSARENRWRYLDPLGRLLFSPPCLALCLLLVGGALAILKLEPSLAPRRSALFFSRHSGPMLLALALLSYGAVFLHEMGHILAARAAGLPARLGIGHRLWVVVIEADLTALWSLPRRERYRPLLAGPLIDAVSWALVTLLLFGESRGWLALPLTVASLLRAMLFVYLMALSWQLFFFVRTDVYYVIATFFNCKNLLLDTEGCLRNLAARLLGRPEPVDQSGIPRAERRVDRGYAVFWALGRLAAFSFLFLVSLPLAAQYLHAMVASLSAARDWRDPHVLDATIGGALVIVPLAIGFSLWMQSLVGGLRRAR